MMDVTVKGLFWLLEECRTSAAFKQIILIGGDAALGHFFILIPCQSPNNRNTARIPAAMRSRRFSKK